MKTKIISCSPEETVRIGRQTGRLLKGGDVIAYRGGLGAGKTAFTRGVAEGMGLDPDEVCSPTYGIVNVYEGDITLCHFDMYRINSPEALASTGFYDYLNDDSVIAAEWSENISGLLPPCHIVITIEVIDENKRCIIIEGDDRFADIGDRYFG